MSFEPEFATARSTLLSPLKCSGGKAGLVPTGNLDAPEGRGTRRSRSSRRQGIPQAKLNAVGPATTSAVSPRSLVYWTFGLL